MPRCFERGEHRYLDLVWPKVSLIIDRDDTRQRPTGEYYPRKRKIQVGFRAVEQEGRAAAGDAGDEVNQ